jgi:hypothetical protein
MSPLDGDGDVFTGGTWDTTSLQYTGDTAFKLVLVGAGDDSTADAFSGTKISIGHSYLASRSSVPADSNLESSGSPTDNSILRNLLVNPFDRTSERDDTRSNAKGEQDNPPYELLDTSDSGDVNHDITEPVELGRATVGLGNTIGQCMVDIPFGIANLRAVHYDAADTNITTPVYISVEVIDIQEMQG